MCIPRATVSAVSCLVVPAFICIDLLISRVLKINDNDDDDDAYLYLVFPGESPLDLIHARINSCSMPASACAHVSN